MTAAFSSQLHFSGQLSKLFVGARYIVPSSALTEAWRFLRVASR